jgi:hypothetical protein
MTETPKLRGMATVSYWAADWRAAKDWYTELIGFEPYFLRDGYAEWRLGDEQDDPFGNLMGVMHNPHYVRIHAANGGAQ